MATYKGTRFSIHFKDFPTHFPMCVWHTCAGVVVFLFQQSRHLLSWKRSLPHPKSSLEYPVNEQWREFDRLLEEGNPLTIEMLEEMEILEAFALLEWLKEKRG